MASIEEKIQSAASKNKELLTILAETDYAASALDQQEKYITNLEQEISALDGTVKKLELIRIKELNQHEVYRDSTVKRFAYTVTGKSKKFQAKASKGEKEYLGALEEEHQAKETRKSTAMTLTQAKQTRADLQSTSETHTKAQRDLDALYESIFKGPSPGYPEEDAKESAVDTAQATCQATRTQLESESQTVLILTQALQKMHSAMRSMDDARSYSRMDMLGGGAITDMNERSALTRADEQSMEAQMLIMQAQRLSPSVKDIPKPNVAQGHLMSDMLFDNILTDMSFHEKIKTSQDEVRNCTKKVEQELSLAKKRLDELREQMKKEGKVLEESRFALQKVREAAFERLSVAPPAYDM